MSYYAKNHSCLQPLIWTKIDKFLFAAPLGPLRPGAADIECGYPFSPSAVISPPHSALTNNFMSFRWNFM